MTTIDSLDGVRVGRALRTGASRLALLLALAACTEGGTEPSDGRVVAGVDLDVLFADPEPAEVGAVLDEWAARNPAATDVTIEHDSVVATSNLSTRVRVVSHDVGGVRHFGAILSAAALVGPAPIMVYAHGGDEGASVEELLLQFGFVGDAAAGFVWIVPSFRSEPLTFAGKVWMSDGPPSPWDRDVDDALSLIDVALELEPAAADNVGVLGFSRGAGVGMLMGIRDPRVDRVVDFFGPTDFFDSYAQDVIEEALLGSLRDLPGLQALDEAYIQPLRRGEVTIPEFRRELIRRSAVAFADRLPTLQVHHGSADPVVAVSQAQSLIAAMETLGRGLPEFEAHIYPGGGHSPLTLPGSIPRAVEFLEELLAAPAPPRPTP